MDREGPDSPTSGYKGKGPDVAGKLKVPGLKSGTNMATALTEEQGASSWVPSRLPGL